MTRPAVLAARGATALVRRRPGPVGTALLPLTWLLLGVALIVYVVGLLVLAFAGVLVATLRLVAGPPLAAMGRTSLVRGTLGRPRSPAA